MEVWVGGGNGPEEIDGCVPDGMMAMDVEELAARAVKAVEGHLIGVNCGPAGTQEGSRCADVGGRWGSKRRIQRDVVGISAVEGTARSAEPLPGPLNMALLVQMARDWNLACSRLRMSASAQRCWWMKRRVARAMMVRLPVAAGVRNAIRSLRRSSHSPISGVSMKHRGVAPAEEHRLLIWKEGADGGEVELHAGSLWRW